MHPHALHSPSQGHGYGTFGQYSLNEWYWEHFQHWYLPTMGFFFLILFGNLCLMTLLSCLAVHWDDMCLGTSSSKPHLLQRRVNWDLPILFSSLLDSSLSDGPDFYISGRVLDKWVCLYQSLGIGVEHPLSWGVHMV